MPEVPTEPIRADQLIPLLADARRTIQILDSSYVNMREDVGEIKNDIKVIRKTLYGNGDLEGGMIGRVNQIEHWMEGQMWFQRLVVGLMLAEGIGILYIILNHVLSNP